jgi:hypothetical protein
MKKIKEVRSELGKDGNGKTKAQLKLENKLDKWLEQRSLVQIGSNSRMVRLHRDNKCPNLNGTATMVN